MPFRTLVRLREPPRQVANLVKTKVDNKFNFQISEQHTMFVVLVVHFTLIAFSSSFMGYDLGLWRVPLEKLMVSLGLSYKTGYGEYYM